VSRPAAFVLLNPAAGRAADVRRLAFARREIEARFEAVEVTLDAAGAWKGAVSAAISRGVRTFVAAGGDGTVHALLTALLELLGTESLEELTLGVAALGSSNDFVKPLRPGDSPVPLRLDTTRAAPRDLVRVRSVDAWGRELTSLLAVSASAGVVAEGNALFNSARRPRRWTVPAIACAAFRAVRRHHDFTCHLTHDGREEEILLSSLSILKSRWLSGALRYDLPVKPDDGLFGVAVCSGMGQFRLFATLAGLFFGRFRNRPGTKSFLTTALGVSADAPFLLEVDGEVERVVEASFDLLAWRVRVCA
jgi:diacylglycerol kinase family enzyme